MPLGKKRNTPFSKDKEEELKLFMLKNRVQMVKCVAFWTRPIFENSVATSKRQ